MFRFAPPFDSERRLTVVAVVVVGALASSSSFFPSNMARVAATFARCDVDVARLAKDVFLFTLGSAGFSVSFECSNSSINSVLDRRFLNLGGDLEFRLDRI